MANIVRSASALIRTNMSRSISIVPTRFAHWNKDWMPGPYPKTEAERRAAAEKYNLHPDEYKPYPDDGFGWGDYPQLPLKGAALRDPYYPYDLPEHKRNFNEPLHVDYDLISEDRCDIGIRERYSYPVMVLSFFGIIGGLFLLCYLSDAIPVFQPVMEKQYPWDGKKHYTFEKK